MLNSAEDEARRSLPGLKVPQNIYFGNAAKPLPDWFRNLPSAEADENEEDDPSDEAIAAVRAVLGFDPNEEETKTNRPTTGIIGAALKAKGLLRR